MNLLIRCHTADNKTPQVIEFHLVRKTSKQIHKTIQALLPNRTVVIDEVKQVPEFVPFTT